MPTRMDEGEAGEGRRAGLAVAVAVGARELKVVWVAGVGQGEEEAGRMVGTRGR